MLKVLFRRTALAGFVFMIFAAGGCAWLEKLGWLKKDVAGPVIVEEVVIGEEPLREDVISPVLLGLAGLEKVWQVSLPIESPEMVERMFIIGDRIYALSGRNYLGCVDSEKGIMIFSQVIAEGGVPVIGLDSYEDTIFSVIGNELVELNAEHGERLEGRRLSFTASGPVARNSSYFYIPGSDNRIHVLWAKDGIRAFEVSADDGSGISSVIAEEDFIIFSTDSGACVKASAGRPDKQWQFDAADGIAGPIVRDGDNLIFASKDTYVYMIGIDKGKLVWKYQAGGILFDSPVVTGSAVYQPVRGVGLTAIDKQSGKHLWDLAGGAALLAESQDKAYVVTNDSELVLMDNKRAEKLYSVNFADVWRYATNPGDSGIYISDKFGRIACLKPVE